MAKFKPQFRRLIHVDERIRRGTQVGSYPNSRELARELEVSRKTVLRDVEYMRYQMDAPIEYHQVRHGYYYTEPEFKLPAIRVKRSDLFAICLAEKVLRQYENTPVYENLVSVFETLGQSMPERVSVDPSWLHGRFSFFAEAAPRLDPETWRTVFEALRQTRTVRFSYRNPGWRKSYKRTVNPYHAISYRAEWYLVGYCHYMKAVRVYAISRMSDARMSDDYYFIPDDFDFKKMAGSHFGIMFGNQTHGVRVRFDERTAPFIRERTWHPSQSIEELEAGLILSFTTNHLFEVRNWILSWGAGARALAPGELVQEVRRELAGALAGYEVESTPGSSPHKS